MITRIRQLNRRWMPFESKSAIFRKFLKSPFSVAWSVYIFFRCISDHCSEYWTGTVGLLLHGHITAYTAELWQYDDADICCGNSDTTSIPETHWFCNDSRCPDNRTAHTVFYRHFLVSRKQQSLDRNRSVAARLSDNRPFSAGFVMHIFYDAIGFEPRELKHKSLRKTLMSLSGR